MKFQYIRFKNTLIAFGVLQSFALMSYAKTDIDVCPSPKKPDAVSYQDVVPRDSVDTDLWLKTLATDLVVQEFFNRPSVLFNFLSMVYTSLDKMLADFRVSKGLADDDAIFIFKGGNMLRMLAHRTFDLITPEARDILKQKYDQFFKRSDADFSILVNPVSIRKRGLNYENTMTELVNLTHQKLNDIRAEIEKTPQKYFGFMQYSDEYRSQILAKYLDIAKEAPDLKDPNNPDWHGAELLQLQFLNTPADGTLKQCEFQGGVDESRMFAEQNEEQIVVQTLDKTERWMRNTINRSLKFYLDEAKTNLVHFDLVRMKIIFNLLYVKDGKIKIAFPAGEGVDVSFPLEKDFRTPELFRHSASNLSSYKLQFKETGEELSFVSESPEGLAADLREIIFGQVSRPWESSKYEKRVYRLFFIGIMQMLAAYGTGSRDMSAYLKNLEANIIERLSEFYQKNTNQKYLQDELKEVLSELKEKYPKLNELHVFMDNILNQLLTNLMNNPKQDDEQQFAALMELIKDNIAQIKSLTTIKPWKIEKDDLSTIQVENLF